MVNRIASEGQRVRESHDRRSRPPSLIALLASAALLALSSGTALLAAGWETGVASLMRTDSAPEGAYGKVRTRSREGREELDVEFKMLMPSTTYRIEFENSEASVESFDVESNAMGSGELSIETEDGDTLPFAATAVADLAGVMVRVLDGEVVVLAGTIAPLFSNKKRTARVTTYLTRPDDPPLERARGRLMLDRNATRGRERMKLQVWGLDAGLWTVVVECGEEDEAFRTFELTGGESEITLVVDSSRGESLPCAAGSLSDLVDTDIEIRQGDAETALADDDSVVVEGEFGDIDSPPGGKPAKGKAKLRDRDTRVKASVDWCDTPKNGNSRLRIGVNGAGGSESISLFMSEDGESEDFVASRSASNGQVWFEFELKKGDGMPLDADTAADLVGVGFVIRAGDDDPEGPVVISGDIPMGR